MTKLTILLIALLFIAHSCCASKWQKQQQQESCSKQLKGINLNPCEKHIMEKIQPGRDDDDDEKDHILIRTMRGRINYFRSKEEKEEEESHMQKCCSELSELKSSKCQCKALQKIMENQSEELEEKEKEQMERELMSLAIMCRLGPMIGCDLSSDD